MTDKSLILEWLFNIEDDDRSMQLVALEQLCNDILFSDNIENLFTEYEPGVFIPALCRIILDEFAPTTVLELASRSLTYFLDVSKAVNHHALSYQNFVIRICSCLDTVDMHDETSNAFGQQIIKMLMILSSSGFNKDDSFYVLSHVLKFIVTNITIIHADVISSGLSLVINVCEKIDEMPNEKNQDWFENLLSLIRYKDAQIMNKGLQSLSNIFRNLSRKSLDLSDLVNDEFIDKLLNLLYLANLSQIKNVENYNDVYNSIFESELKESVQEMDLFNPIDSINVCFVVLEILIIICCHCKAKNFLIINKLFSSSEKYAKNPSTEDDTHDGRQTLSKILFSFLINQNECLIFMTNKFIEVVVTLLYEKDLMFVEENAGRFPNLSYATAKRLKSKCFGEIQAAFEEDRDSIIEQYDVLEWIIQNYSLQELSRLKDSFPDMFQPKKLPMAKSVSLMDIVLENNRVDLVQLLTPTEYEGDPLLQWKEIDCGLHPIEKCLWRSYNLACRLSECYKDKSIFDSILGGALANIRFEYFERNRNKFLDESCILLTHVYNNSIVQSIKFQNFTLLSKIIGFMSSQDLQRLSEKQLHSFRFSFYFMNLLESVLVQEREEFLIPSISILVHLLKKQQDLYYNLATRSGIFGILLYLKKLLQNFLSQNTLESYDKLKTTVDMSTTDEAETKRDPLLLTEGDSRTNEALTIRPSDNELQSDAILKPHVAYKWQEWKVLLLPGKEQSADKPCLHCFNDYAHIFFSLRETNGTVQIKCLYNRGRRKDGLKSIQVSYRNGVRTQSKKNQFETIAMHLFVEKEYERYVDVHKYPLPIFGQILLSSNNDTCPVVFQRFISLNNESEDDAIRLTQAGDFNLIFESKRNTLIVQKRFIKKNTKDLMVVLKKDLRSGFKVYESCSTYSPSSDGRREFSSESSLPHEPVRDKRDFQDLFYSSPPLIKALSINEETSELNGKSLIRLEGKRVRLYEMITSLLDIYNCDTPSIVASLNADESVEIEEISLNIQHCRDSVLVVQNSETIEEVLNNSPIMLKLRSVMMHLSEHFYRMKHDSVLQQIFTPYEIAKTGLFKALHEMISVEAIDIYWPITHNYDREATLQLKYIYLEKRRQLFLDSLASEKAGCGLNLLIRYLILHVERSERFPLNLFEFTTRKDAKWRVPREEMRKVHQHVDKCELLKTRYSHGMIMSFCLNNPRDPYKRQSLLLDDQQNTILIQNACQTLSKYFPYLVLNSKNRLDQLSTRIKITVSKWMPLQGPSNSTYSDGLFNFNGEFLWFTPLVTVDYVKQSLLKLCTLQWYEEKRPCLGFYKQLLNSQEQRLTFLSPFDNGSVEPDFSRSGLIDWIATNGDISHLDKWVNPASKNLIAITTNDPEDKICDNSVNIFAPKCGSLSVNVVAPGAGVLLHGYECIEAWHEKTKRALFSISDLGIYIDLGVQIIPTAYSLAFIRNLDEQNANVGLRSWNFDVSNDCEVWNTLCVHFDEDQIVSQPGSGGCWRIPYCSQKINLPSASDISYQPQAVDLSLDLKSTDMIANYSKGWRYVRLVRNSWQPNSSWNLPVGGFEIYGTVIHIHEKIHSNSGLQQLVKSSTSYTRRKVTSFKSMSKNPFRPLASGFKRKSTVVKSACTQHVEKVKEDEKKFVFMDAASVSSDVEPKKKLLISNQSKEDSPSTFELMDIQPQNSDSQSTERQSTNEDASPMIEPDFEKTPLPERLSRSCSLEMLPVDVVTEDQVSDQILEGRFKRPVLPRRFKNNSESCSANITSQKISPDVEKLSKDDIDRLEQEKRNVWRISQLSVVNPPHEIIPAFDPNRGKGNVPASSEFDHNVPSLEDTEPLELCISKEIKIGDLPSKQFLMPMTNKDLPLFHYIYKLVEKIDEHVESILSQLIREGVNLYEKSTLNSGDCSFESIDSCCDISHPSQRRTGDDFHQVIDDSFPQYIIRAKQMILHYSREPIQLTDDEMSPDEEKNKSDIFTNPIEINAINIDEESCYEQIDIPMKLIKILTKNLSFKTNSDSFTKDAKEGVVLSDFVSSKLTQKLSHQLYDPLSIATRTLPVWCLDLALKFPVLFPFDLRHSMFHRLAIGNARTVIWLQNNGPVISSNINPDSLRNLERTFSTCAFKRFYRNSTSENNSKSLHDKETPKSAESDRFFMSSILQESEGTFDEADATRNLVFSSVLSNLNSALSLGDEEEPDEEHSSYPSTSALSSNPSHNQRTTDLGSTLTNFEQMLDSSENDYSSEISTISRKKQTFEIARLHKELVKINRDAQTFMSEAMKVMKSHATRKTELEIQFIGEQGTGLGPTLEFYHLLSMEFSRKATLMWIFDDANPEDEFVNHPAGLFPAPYDQKRVPEQTLDFFFVLGVTIAKSLLDKRRLNMQFSMPFLKLVQAFAAYYTHHCTLPTFEMKNQPMEASDLERIIAFEEISTCSSYPFRKNAQYKSLDNVFFGALDIEDFTALYPERREFFKKCQRFLYEKERIVTSNGDQHLNLEDMSREIFGSVIDELCLELVYLPTSKKYNYSDVQLTDKNQEALTVNNIDEFYHSTLDFCLYKGIEKQMSTLIKGFTRVLPIQWLALFNTGSPTELSWVLCGEQTISWTRQDLLTFTQPGFGFTSTSPTYLWLIDILCEDFTNNECRQFLKFITGSSSLPVGGLKNLQPVLTIVKKDSTASGPYPSVNTCRHFLKLISYETKRDLREHLLEAFNYTEFHLN